MVGAWSKGGGLASLVNLPFAIKLQRMGHPDFVALVEHANSIHLLQNTKDGTEFTSLTHDGGDSGWALMNY